MNDRFTPDSVANVAEAKLWNRNLKRSNQPAWIFESTLRIGGDLESILRARKSEIVLQHNPPYERTYAAAIGSSGSCQTRTPPRAQDTMRPSFAVAGRFLDQRLASC